MTIELKTRNKNIYFAQININNHNQEMQKDYYYFFNKCLPLHFLFFYIIQYSPVQTQS